MRHECKITTEWRHLFALGMVTEGSLRKWVTSSLFDEHLITTVAQFVEPQILKSEKLEDATDIVIIGDSLISYHLKLDLIRLFSLRTRQFIKERMVKATKIWTDGKLLYLYHFTAVSIFSPDLVQRSSFPPPPNMPEALQIGCHKGAIYYNSPMNGLFSYDGYVQRKVEEKVCTMVSCGIHLYVIKERSLMKILPNDKTITLRGLHPGETITSYNASEVIVRSTPNSYSLANADNLWIYPYSIHLSPHDRAHRLFVSGPKVFIHFKYQNVVYIFNNPFGSIEN